MRGASVGRMSQCSAILPQTLLQILPSSNCTIFGPFSNVFCACPKPSEAAAASPLTSDVLPPPLSKASFTGRHCLPEELHSCDSRNSLTHERALPHYFRSISSSSSHCWHGTLAQSCATPTRSSDVVLGRWGRRRFTDASTERTERRCLSCGLELATGDVFHCPSCDAIQPLDPTVDFFQIFSIDRSFKVDSKALEQRYKSLQKRLHPDLAGSKSEKERGFSAEQSAHVIQAYYILLRPLSRARYLLGLHGINIEEEGTIDDPELLMEIMEIRESIDEISDDEALKDAEANNNVRIRNCEKELESSFRHEDLKRAVSGAQRLAYFIKVGEEIRRKL